MESGSKIAWYVEDALSKGKQEDKDGWYIFTKKEIADAIDLSPETVYRNISKAMYYLKSRTFAAAHFDVEENQIYTSMKWEKGKLMFKRNPLTNDIKYQYLFGCPRTYYWAYESYDDKHRRRGNVGRLNGKAFGWHFKDEEIEDEIREMKEKGIKIWACPYFGYDPEEDQ